MTLWLKITNGVTTYDLAGGSAANFFNLLAGGWAPNIATRSANQLSGPQFNDVEEAMTLYAGSSTDAAKVLENIDAIAALLDEAARKFKGEKGARAVTLQYSPNSIASAYSEVAIIGGRLELSENFGQNLYQEIEPVCTLEFLRRGLWLGPEEEKTVTAAVGNNPDVMAVTFTDDAIIPAPVEIELTMSSTATYREGYTLIGASADHIKTINAADATLITNPSLFSTVVESTAMDGEILVFDPSTGNGGAIAFRPALEDTMEHVYIVINIENISTTITYTLTLYHAYTDISKTLTIPPSLGKQVLIFELLHILRNSAEEPLIEISVAKDGTDTKASHALHFDSLTALGVGDPTGRIITLKEVTSYIGVTGDTVYNHNALTEPQATIRNNFSSVSRSTNDRGDPYIVSNGDSVAACVIVNTNGDWGAFNTAGSTKQNIGMVATRRRGHLVPQ